MVIVIARRVRIGAWRVRVHECRHRHRHRRARRHTGERDAMIGVVHRSAVVRGDALNRQGTVYRVRNDNIASRIAGVGRRDGISYRVAIYIVGFAIALDGFI